MTFQNQVISNRPASCCSCLSSLWVIFFILLTVAQSAHGQAVKILSLGDSWTEGVGHHVSYRYDLWFKLIDAGFDVDFVGNKRNTFDGPDMDLYPKYLTEFDRDHQADAGFRTDQLVATAKSASARHQPDIVLLWAGGADLGWQEAAGVVMPEFISPISLRASVRLFPELRFYWLRVLHMSARVQNSSSPLMMLLPLLLRT